MDKYNGPHARKAKYYSQQVRKSATATTPKSTFRSPQFTIPQAKRDPLPVNKSAEAENDKFVEHHYHTIGIFIFYPFSELQLRKYFNKQRFRAFLGMFAELQKQKSISFVNSIGLSVCPHGTTRLQLDGFSLNLIFE
jgi:hypothetical protein